MSQSKTRLTVLVSTFIDAVTMDEKPEEGGFDLSAGMFGVHVSSWMRGLAAEMDAMEAKMPAVGSTVTENHGLDTDNEVFFYERDFYPLSNFSAFSLVWDGIKFKTSEAAYHWEKFPGHFTLQTKIRSAASAHAAFKLAEAHRAERRKDWDDVKVGIMRGILRAKVAQHEYVYRKLLATGDRTLIEDSWRDDFWGWGPNRDGQNTLGKLWMEIRSELRSAIAPTYKKVE